MRWRIGRIGIDLFLIICLVFISIGINRSIQVSASEHEEEPIYSVDTQDKAVSLTFDVNWAEKDNLESILNILKKYNVKGTFFIMGGWVDYSEDNVNKLKSIKEGGHEIGNHSYKHPSFTRIGEERMKEELKKTDDIIEKYTGDRPKLFRFPSGDYNKQAFLKVRNLGYMAIQWNADSVDWKELGAETEYKRVMKNIKPGSIMLFHNNAKYTPGNLERIIKELQSDGYTFKTVGEMIYSSDYSVDKEGIQHKNN
ncbi:polysaccharide deacetylase family protein [Clostridium saccharobutylicum]|uniref:Peptidoglycan-N-acetylmuramic acid deacetylase PdaA n=1 Tax=Clostridium saccharobutylicum TaxID=169679 RepID=A0A1S8MYL5_CLOSA|nr:polysaccharide deacetylase family protein [Clostridium saccharobutylicum]OOM09260.1 peptidoglycan-N-acetylmuramic acid deacetylase PdaA precursor [Clostridium saccharobutylicum]